MTLWLALGLALAAVEVGARAQKNDSQSVADEALLREAGWAIHGEGLLAPFRKLTLSREQLARAQQLIEELGSEEYHVRDRASRTLIALGPATIILLREAKNDQSPERSRRATKCLAELERALSAGQLEAAIRLIKSRRPSGSCAVAKAFQPFACDEGVRAELASAIAALEPDRKPAADPSPTVKARQAADNFFRALAAGDLEQLRNKAGLPFSVGEFLSLESQDEFDELFAQAAEEWRKDGHKPTWNILHVARASDYPASAGERRFFDRCGAGDVRVVFIRACVESDEEEPGVLFVRVGAEKVRILGLGRTGSRDVE